jgi:dipeptidyl aminopeptidase/acylaminoacyl peptidase
LDDHAVPPSQTEEMIKALNANKVPNAYVTYAGEGHGECLKMHGFGAKLHKDG